MRIIVELRGHTTGREGRVEEFPNLSTPSNAVAGTSLYIYMNAAAPIALVVLVVVVVEEGETRKSTVAYSVGAISIEMGLETTKIYKTAAIV